MMDFNTAAIFEHAGGTAALRRALTEDQGQTPAEATVAMWKSRDRIAQAWVAACVYAVLYRNPTLSLKDLIKVIPDVINDYDDNPF